MRFKVGDQIRHPEFPHLIREIKEVRPTGYIWFYPNAAPPKRLFDSEDGTNPTFSEPWELVCPEDLKKATGFQRLKSLEGTTVTETSGIFESIFHERNHFHITFSNGLCLSLEEFRDGTYIITLD